MNDRYFSFGSEGIESDLIKKETRFSQFCFYLAIVTFAAVILKEMTVGQLGVLPAVIFTLLTGVSLGCAVAFGGIAFSKKYQKAFRILLVVQFSLNLFMNLLAAVSVGVMDNGVVMIDYIGFAAVATNSMLLVLLIFMLPLSKTLPKKVNLALFGAVAAIYLFLSIWAAIGAESGILPVCCEILQNVQIVSVACFAAGENRNLREGKNNGTETGKISPF